LTLLTADRPALFSTISGVLAAWGMNIIKADAFANAAALCSIHSISWTCTAHWN